MACFRLGVAALLTAATLGGVVVPLARAEPGTGARAGEACKRGAFRVILDVGHTAEAPGAKSARGVYEYVFNLSLAKRIEQELLAAGFARTVLLITDGPSRKGLFERVSRANKLGAELFLSIHHDSVPDKFLEKWEFEGEERSFSDRFNGHSIFVSQNHSDRAGSMQFARLLGDQLRDRGLQYTPHYTERFMGNRQRLLVDARSGVYRYDQLIVLKNTSMPAVLLEAGSIINRDEELRMASSEHQTLISTAVTEAVERFCAARRPRAPTTTVNAPTEPSRQNTVRATMAPPRMVKQR